MTTQSQQDLPEQQQPIPKKEIPEPGKKAPEKDEGGFEPNFFFDVREAESLKDLYARMKILKKPGEDVDWRSVDPREYMFDNDDDTDELDGDTLEEEPEEEQLTKSDDLKMLSAKAVIEDSSKKFLS